ncbi:hypothetical protein [Rhizohabitans arisaemae]|uniref:hypothetical protein n=1 Tax=Rhizohabitans arisaemae TaxID=2720610 RepID=UPI0024B1FC1B|nr:hypothetical protein [Rhizohabitans arisaemae]
MPSEQAAKDLCSALELTGDGFADDVVRALARCLDRWVVWRVDGDGLWGLPKWLEAYDKVIKADSPHELIDKAAEIEWRYPPAGGPRA